MKETVRIRRMTAADIDAVVEIANALPEAPHWPRDAYAQAVEPAAAPERIALVAESAGGVAGFAVVLVLPPEGELESIAVGATVQRRGIARALLHGLVEELASRGVTELRLEVRASNAAALGLYTGMRFVESGRRRGYYAEPAEDAVLMLRTLEHF